MSESKSDTATHYAYQTISWTYRFTKEKMMQRIIEEDAMEELFQDFTDLNDMEKAMARLSAQELLDLIIEIGLHEWILGIDYSIKDATDGSSIKTGF
jgi:dimeric dUTPase (all-alpha-NTP-PPase superfamily)